MAQMDSASILAGQFGRFCLLVCLRRDYICGVFSEKCRDFKGLCVCRNLMRRMDSGANPEDFLQVLDKAVEKTNKNE